MIKFLKELMLGYSILIPSVFGMISFFCLVEWFRKTFSPEIVNLGLWFLIFSLIAWWFGYMFRN